MIEEEQKQRERAEHQRLLEINAWVAEAVYGLTVGWFDWLGLGNLSPWIVDTTARKTGEHSYQASVLGGAWERVRDRTGTVVEIYGRIVPGYANTMTDAWQLVEHFRIPSWREPTKEEWWRHDGFLMALETDQLWPEAIFSLTPERIAVAAIRAATAPMVRSTEP